MNKTTRRILAVLLQDKKAWQWEGKRKNKRPTEPNLTWIQGHYWRTWEGIWVEEIYLHQMFRAYKLFKIIKEGAFGGSYQDLDYVKSHFGSALIDGDPVLTIECDRCLYDLQMQLSDGDYMYPRECFVDWWLREHPEWYMEEITPAFITELGIKPEHQMRLKL